MQMPLKLGDQIPDFSLSDQLGVSRTNKQAKGRPLVLFFYPKDDTPGCTAENCGFRDKYDLFKLFGAEVWGVSGDDEASHRSFADKNKLPFPLLCDEDNLLRTFSDNMASFFNTSSGKGFILTLCFLHSLKIDFRSPIFPFKCTLIKHAILYLSIAF